jgi:hypothetical protein
LRAGRLVVSLHERMSPSEVSQMIAVEVDGDWNRANPHGVDLRTCLVTPERRRFVEASDESQTCELWLVLEERPQTRGGYKIVFDDLRRQYGLAVTDQHGRDVFVGYYGTFLETLDAM